MNLKALLANRKTKHSVGWWGLVFFHNMVAHPLLAIGDVLDAVKTGNSVSKGLFWLHDNSAPYGDD